MKPRIARKAFLLPLTLLLAGAVLAGSPLTAPALAAAAKKPANGGWKAFMGPQPKPGDPDFTACSPSQVPGKETCVTYDDNGLVLDEELRDAKVPGFSAPDENVKCQDNMLAPYPGPRAQGALCTLRTSTGKVVDEWLLDAAKDNVNFLLPIPAYDKKTQDALVLFNSVPHRLVQTPGPGVVSNWSLPSQPYAPGIAPNGQPQNQGSMLAGGGQGGGGGFSLPNLPSLPSIGLGDLADGVAAAADLVGAAAGLAGAVAGGGGSYSGGGGYRQPTGGANTGSAPAYTGSGSNQCGWSCSTISGKRS